MTSYITSSISASTHGIAVGNPQSGGAWYTSKRIPLRKLELSQSLVPRDAKRAEAVRKLIELQSEQLEEWDGIDGFTCELPETNFEGRTALPPLSDLMRKPDDSELPDLVRDESGAQRFLTPEMVLALKRDGRFSFPSAAHPPLEHVWQLPSWLQRGSVRICTDFLAWIGCAIDQVFVHCKSRIWTAQKQGSDDQKKGRNLWRHVQVSLWKGIKNFVKGVVRLVDLIVGVPSYIPRYRQYQLEEKFAEEEIKFLLQNASSEMDMRLYSDESRNAIMWDMRKTFMASNRYQHHTRYDGMSDKEMRVELAREYSTIFDVQEENSSQAGSDHDIEGEVETDGVESEEEIQYNTDESHHDSDDGVQSFGIETDDEVQYSASEYERMERLVTAYRKKLDRESLVEELKLSMALFEPPIKALAEAELKASFIRADILAKASSAVEDRRAEVEQRVRDDAPFRSLGQLWLEQEVRHRMRTLSPEAGGNALERTARGEIEGQELRYKVSAIHSGLEDEVIQALEALGPDFSQEALLERLRLRFRREHWPYIENMMIHERVPAIEKTHRRIKYRTRNWYVDEDGVQHVFVESKTSSSFLGWRLVGLVQDTWAHAVNGLFNIIIVNLWGGSLGVQALFRPCKFTVETQRSPERRDTFVSRLQAIWTDVREKRMQFEASEDTGFVSKSTVRWLHYIRYYVLRGALASVVVVVMQPFLTVLNIIISLILVVSVPIWPLLLTVLSYLFSAFVYDFHAFRDAGVIGVKSYDVFPFEDRYVESDELGGFFPLLKVAWLAVMSGAGQFILSALCFVVVHPLLAVASATLGSIATLFRTGTDAVFRALLARFGRWPATDSWLAQRVGGPGISSNYYYRVNQDLISQCVRARLEKVELEIVKSILFAAIGEPEEAFELYCVDTTRHIFAHGRPDMSGFFSDSAIGQRLQGRGNIMRTRLSARLRRREKIFDPLLQMPVDRNRIRPACEPAVAIADNVDAVRTFYETRLKPLGEEYSLNIWKEAAIPMGDMFGLTRYFLLSIFCKDFLVELSTSDISLIIPVSFDAVLDLDNLQINASRVVMHCTREMN